MRRANLIRAAIAAACGSASLAGVAEATIVTVTSGPNPGVVFNSNGYEGTAGTLPAPSVGTYTPILGTVAGGNTSTATVQSVAPPGSNQGSGYLNVARTNGTIGLGQDFSRSITLATESFTIDFALFGTTTASAFGIGTLNIDAAVTGEPEVLAGFRYNTTFQQYKSSGQAADTDEVQTMLHPVYKANEWNILRFTHAAGGTDTLTLNGVTANLLPRVGTNGPPATVQRFYVSPGAANTSLFLDAVPEPASLAVAAAGVALFARRRRAASI